MGYNFPFFVMKTQVFKQAVRQTRCLLWSSCTISLKINYYIAIYILEQVHKKPALIYAL